METDHPEKFSDPNNLTDMPVGYRRVYIHITRLYNCCKQALGNENQALALYQSKARQWTFYLQALTRLYKKMHDEKFFKQLKDEFKQVEDQLGRIDYYDGWLKKFSSKKDFPTAILKHWEERKQEELLRLRSLMEKKAWLGGNLKAQEKILIELKKADWLDARDDRKKIANIIADDIKGFERDYENGRLHFKELEQGLHEFRRQLRWFSIYAQALEGLIQLRLVSAADPNLKKYMTDAVLNSPYNQLPENTLGIEPINIEAPNFYALSFLIDELGVLKDSGLCMKEIAAVAIKTGLCKEGRAQNFAWSITDTNAMTSEEILDHAKGLADIFLNEDKVLKRIRKNILES